MQTFKQRYREFAHTQSWEITPHHEIIIEEVFKIHNHFHENDLMQRRRLYGISRQVVTEMLKRLVESGLIRKIYFGRGRVYFEHVYGHLHHDHLICVNCGEIKEFRDKVIERQQSKLCAAQGYTILKHSLHILGICPKCQKLVDESGKTFSRETTPITKGEEVTLSAISNGHRAQVTRLEGGLGLQRRLREMGIVPGTEIEVLSNQFAGPFLIRVRGSRLAIGHHITHKIIAQQLGKSKTSRVSTENV
ncbi:transcriptional repressor [bacterium]|nr:transcriptional repressor [bacterium]